MPMLRYQVDLKRDLGIIRPMNKVNISLKILPGKIGVELLTDILFGAIFAYVAVTHSDPNGIFSSSSVVTVSHTPVYLST